MSLVIDLNDAGIRLADVANLHPVAPGFALLKDRSVEISGAKARASSRLHPRRTQVDFWYRLDTQPITNFEPLTRADLAASQLGTLLEPVAKDQRAGMIVVPPFMSRTALGLLQGICQAVGFRITALIDAATAATRHRYVDVVPLHLEIGLHCAWVAKLRQTSSATTLEDVQILEGSGLLALYDTWIRWFSSEFVRQSRFDPLHSATSEQALFDALPEWLATVTEAEQQTLVLDMQDNQYSIEVSQVDVVNVVFDHFQRIADLSRAMLASGETPVFQLRDETAALPGLAALLVARVGGSYVALPDEAMVDGVQARRSRIDEDATRVVRELPVEGEVAGLITDDVPVHGVPTHILFGESAYSLIQAPLVIGNGGAPGLERYLALDGGLAGVSGVHCELSVEGGQCLLVDRSRYGTFLNGSRINGSAALRAGDTIRGGTPGQELFLIREEHF